MSETTDTTGETDDIATPVANGRDAVQRTLNARAIVGVEFADAGLHMVDVFPGHGVFAENALTVGVTDGGPTAQIQNHFQ